MKRTKESKKLNKKMFIIVGFALFLFVLGEIVIVNKILKNQTESDVEMIQNQEQVQTLTGHLKQFCTEGIADRKIGDDYYVCDDEIWYERRMLEGADVGSFELLDNGYSKDKEHIFYLNKEVANIDFATFELLKNCYVQDKDAIYCAGFVVEEADRENFKALGYGYAKDDKHVFKGSKIIEGADAKTFNSVYPYSAGFTDKNRGYLAFGEKGKDILPLDDFWFFEYGKGGEKLLGNYRRYKDKVYYWDAGGQAVPAMILLDLDVQKIVVNSKYYIKDDENVYADNDFEMKNVDAKSFVDLGIGYGKDKDNIFKGIDILTDVDRETFEVLADKSFAIDENGVIYQGARIEGADRKTFKVLGFEYSKDDKSVFFQGKKVPKANPREFKVLNRDMQFKQSYYSRDAYAQDGVYVFSGEEILENVDAKTFEILGDNLSRDRNYVYTGVIRDNSSGKTVIKKWDEVDVETFVFFNNVYTKDKNGAYHNRVKMEDVDSSSFNAMDTTYAKDNRKVYCNGNELLDADSKTFELVNDKMPEYTAKDLHHRFMICDEVEE